MPEPALSDMSEWQIAKGRSKQKNKDVAKQPQPQQQQHVQQIVPNTQKSQQQPLQVPQSQPSKPNNKANKMREINLKGANKEGTDMDAFSDTVLPSIIDLKLSSVDSSPSLCENVNTSDLPPTVNDVNKKSDVDVLTVKPEVKSQPRNKVNVTDIVKEHPKPFVPPPECRDETDRMESVNEKLVQMKNEVNAKSVLDVDLNIGEQQKCTLPYKEGQWSPSNPSGKKVYDKDFLMALKNDPKSKQRPENLLDAVMQEDRGRIGDINRYPMGGRMTDFTPSFGSAAYPGKSSSQRGLVTKRGSQQGKIGGSKTGKPNNVVRLSFSVSGNVKLHEVENAWKPARFNPSGNLTDEEKKTQELYKRVRGVLNKLTPQKFNTLVNQVRALPIDNTERLQGVIDLVFEKAVDEPNFSSAYSLMCKELAQIQVPSNNKNEGEFVNFKKVIITRCQMEFEKNSIDESVRNTKVKEIEECTDPDKKKELQVLLEEEDARLRRKSVGNIRFIGELFKQNMLTVGIMLRCLNNLLENKDEESLECLCKLLTTVGKEVEEKKVDLSSIFNAMKEIVDKKHTKISSRVRFMLQDVIDLRNAKWVPRRQDLNPKTIDQIQKEAHDEHLTIQAMNSAPISSRKDDRNMSIQNSDRKRRNNVSDTEGWSTAQSRNKQFSVQSDKLKSRTPLIDEPLGSRQMFGNWVGGSNIKTSISIPGGNMYAALDTVGNDIEKRANFGLRSKETYNSKGPSLERNYKSSYEDGRGSRSGSQQRSQDNSIRNVPIPTPIQQNIIKVNPPPPNKPVPVIEELNPESELKIFNILEEYQNDLLSITDCNEEIKAIVPASLHVRMVSNSYIHVLERSRSARQKTSHLFAQLIKLNTLSLTSFASGLEEVLGQAEDLIIDIPKIWDYFAEIIATLLIENVFPLQVLITCSNVLIEQGYASKLLPPIFKLVVEDKGPNYLGTLWQQSGLDLSNIIGVTNTSTFIKDNQLECLVEVGNPQGRQNELSFEQIHDKLIQMFRQNISYDDIYGWIMANVGENVKGKKFIRALVTAIFENSIVNNNTKFKMEILMNNCKFITRFVDGNPEFELQCLYALQALIHRLEHPQGILLQICNCLYEDNIFSHDSFIAWETSTDPAEQEGKGVALKQLTSFFTQMKEADEFSSESEDA